MNGFIEPIFIVIVDEVMKFFIRGRGLNLYPPSGYQGHSAHDGEAPEEKLQLNWVYLFINSFQFSSTFLNRVVLIINCTVLILKLSLYHNSAGDVFLVSKVRLKIETKI